MLSFKELLEMFVKITLETNLNSELRCRQLLLSLVKMPYDDKPTNFNFDGQFFTQKIIKLAFVLHFLSIVHFYSNFQFVEMLNHNYCLDGGFFLDLRFTLLFMMDF